MRVKGVFESVQGVGLLVNRVIGYGVDTSCRGFLGQYVAYSRTVKFPSLFRKAGKRPAKKPFRRGKSELDVQLEQVVRSKREAERKAAELQREIDVIPGKIKRLEEHQRRAIHDRAVRTPTVQGLGRPVQKLHSVADGFRLTRTQNRNLRNRLLILCAVFAGVLIVLWRTVR